MMAHGGPWVGPPSFLQPTQFRPSPMDLRCPYCGQPARLLFIHGHGQCERCGTNIDECCRGESAREDANDLPSD